MSHKSWLPALAASVLASLAATPALGQSFFDGAYGGAQLSQTIVPFDTKESGDETTNAGVAEGPGGGVLVGYGRRNGQLYYGGEGGFGLSTSSFNQEADGGDDVRVTTRSSVTVAGRAGFVRTEQALIYGRLGWKQTQFEFDIEPDTGASGTSITELGGWLFGLGVEVPLLKVVNLRAEYTLVRYDGHDVDYRDAADTRRFIPEEKTIQVGAVYRF